MSDSQSATYASPTAPQDATKSLRWGVYWILIALAVGNMTGRLLAVNTINRTESERRFVQLRLQSVEKKLRARELEEDAVQERLDRERPQIEAEEAREFPFLSGNDRSRWLAIRALVDHGTFEIDELLDRHRWNTIDMVQHENRDGELRLYSSKPPLFYVLAAGEYWALQKLTGWTLADNPYKVGRTILFTINVLPLALMIWLVGQLAERFGKTDLGRVFVVAAAALGTMLTPFAVVMNNHLPAAVSAAVAIYAFARIWCDDDHSFRLSALCGLAAAFTAANELPALSMLVLMSAALLVRNPAAWLRGFLPAAALIVVAFFATNYWAHDSLRPPYMHRSETDQTDNWYAYKYTIDGQERESYWLNPKGVDVGEPDIAVYALHVLVGHHGIFSLTPVWILSFWGLAIWSLRGPPRLRELALGIFALSAVCLVFYIGLRPQADRNYGGMTSGFRWMFWFAPLWLLAMLPAADRAFANRWGQAIAIVFLAVSVLSASYPTWNPWTSPWIEVWMKSWN